MLDLGDLINLIRLTELEIQNLQSAIVGDDELEKNDAGEVLIQFDALSQKLKNMYEQKYTPECEYPLYTDYIKQFQSSES